MPTAPGDLPAGPAESLGWIPSYHLSLWAAQGRSDVDRQIVRVLADMDVGLLRPPLGTSGRPGGTVGETVPD